MVDDDSYLQNLSEFVLEEKNLITYRWLSSILCVPADVSKVCFFFPL